MSLKFYLHSMLQAGFKQIAAKKWDESKPDCGGGDDSVAQEKSWDAGKQR